MCSSDLNLGRDKMGRPKGSKNKTITITTAPATLAKQVNWEKLAKQLQQSLKSEIAENEELARVNNELKQISIADKVIILDQAAIINYLEKKVGYHSV